MGRLLLILGAVGCCVAAVVATGAGARSAAKFSCDGSFNHQTFGNVDVPSAAVCRMNQDTVNGNLTVEGQLYASSLDVGGSVVSDGGKVVQIDSSTIGGDLTVKNLTGAPADQDAVSIDINTVQGDLKVKNNSGGTGDFLVSSDTVGGKEKVLSNEIPGDLAVTAENVQGQMSVSDNSGAGTKEVDGNTSATQITCTNNDAPFESHGNTAPKVKNQCH